MALPSLDETLITTLRNQAMAGITAAALATRFGIDITAVQRAIRGSAKLRRISDEEQERFWSKVEPSDDPPGCWHWTGGTAKGRGQFAAAGTTYQAHRLAYILERGHIPDGWTVRQRCDNLLCVNPDHLVACPKPNTVVAGVHHPLARLTPRQVEAIRDIRAAHVPYQTIADLLQLGESTIRRVVSGERYHDAPGPVSKPERDESSAMAWEAVFLDALRQGWSIPRACRSAEISEGTAWYWRTRRRAFGAAWDAARAAAVAHADVRH